VVLLTDRRQTGSGQMPGTDVTRSAVKLLHRLQVSISSSYVSLQIGTRTTVKMD